MKSKLKMLGVLLVSAMVFFSCGKDDEVKNPDEKKGENSGKWTYPEDEKVFVEGGTFMMGSKDIGNDYWLKNQTPQHEVTVKSFYIGKYEVTTKQFAEYVNAKKNKYIDGFPIIILDSEYCQFEKKNGIYQPKEGQENRPVMDIWWKLAKDFAEWVGGRLPTEAEWEYAARGGKKSKNYTYAGSNNVDEVAWHSGNSSKAIYSFPVGQKKANELGIYDMSGNVWELCEDKWHSDYTNAPTDGSAWIETNGREDKRVRRGGGYMSSNERSITYRTYDDGDEDNGFRVVFDVKEDKK